MRRLDWFQTDAAIIEALLGANAEPGKAEAILCRARELGCDPLTALIHASGEDQDAVYARAASMFGLTFVDDIAPFIVPFGPRANIDAFGQLSSVRGCWRGVEVVFLAPGLRQFVDLAGRDANARQVIVTSPRALTDAIVRVNAARLAEDAIQRIVRQYPHGSANTELRRPCCYGLLAIMLAIAFAALFAQTTAQPVVLPVLALLLVSPSALRIWAALTARENVPLAPRRLLPDAELPCYSVLVPLRDEAHMVPQLAGALRRLDYPPEKLDIKFVVESASQRTVMAVKRYLGDARFSLVVVPKMPPHTKPKALNFALPLARGRHVTVFDAEDVPERDQLRKAASLLAERPDIACLQAQLLITNARRNWVTRLFAAEYAGLFGVLLPGISRLGLPVPLGGTSNHFRIDILRRAGGWDAFNVTEDADLGVRYARLGHKIASFASYTSEESTVTVHAWLRQRSRWMKGWMQTLIVHSAYPGRLLGDLGWVRLLGFQVMVAGMVLSISVHGLLLVSTLAQAIIETIRFGMPGGSVRASLVVLGVGYVGAIAIGVIGLARVGRRDLWAWQTLLPVYWMLAWVATARAVIELIRRPYHWAKTHHSGMHAMEKKGGPGG